MAKKISPVLVEILQKYGERAEDALWDCHGTWVAYHAAIERIAAKAGVVFDMPQIIEANSASKVVAIAVRGNMGDRSEWSFGEASPGNNKNSYPYAMAEKRAKDRVVLKLVGLHGLVYSEEESDDFRADSAPVPSPAPKTASSAEQKRGLESIEADLLDCPTISEVDKCAKIWASIMDRDGWSKDFRDIARPKFAARREAIRNAEPQDDEQTAAIRQEITKHFINAG